MFLFQCCTSHEGQYSYEVRQNYKKIDKVNSTNNLIEKINNSKQFVIKIKKSQIQDKLNNIQKAKDFQFSPSELTLGNIPSVSTCNWKRLSELTSYPTLFTTSKVKVRKASKNSLTGDYFLSALAAIVKQPKRLKDIFVTQQISSNGIYVLRLRVNGQIQQIVVDDYVPVNEVGQSIFSAPNQSQIWLPLLQKAWAKVNKSYANILNGNSAQVLKAFNFAPSQIFYLEDKQEKKQKLWKLLNQAVNRKSPITCMTSHEDSIDWIHMNLIPSCHYILLHVAEVFHKDKRSYRMVKLANPNSRIQWQGKGSIHDTQFWANTLASQQKVKLLENLDQKQGEIIMLYADFVKFFSEVYVSYQLQQSNFIWQEVFFNRKNGSFWQVDILHEGEYSFELHQQSLRNEELNQEQNEYGRSTILLARVNEPKNYEFVNGAMRFTEEDVLVNGVLKQGKYMIYTKIQSEKKQIMQNNKYSLSCYSNKLCKFRLVEKKNCQDFLQNMFLNYARQNKRQFYNRQKMWLSWKLFFKQCGFAYIAFGNLKDSDKKFTIRFESKDFQFMHFKLKSPFKANKNLENTIFETTVLPGEEKIILARVMNDRVTTLKFPPPMEMKIEEINL